VIPSERIIALLPRRSAWFRAARFGKRHEILLSGFERIHFGTGGALRVHCKPDRPNHHPDHAGRDVLRDLGVVLLGELFGLQVIRLDLGADHGAVALRVLRLHNGDRMRVTSGAVRQDQGGRKSQRKYHRASHAGPQIAAAHRTFMFAKCSTRLCRAAQERSSSDCRNMIPPQAAGVGRPKPKSAKPQGNRRFC
jgi:hypothetical protein